MKTRRILATILAMLCMLFTVPEANAQGVEATEMMALSRVYTQGLQQMKAGDFESAAGVFDAMNGYLLSDGYSRYCKARQDHTCDVDYRAEFSRNHAVGAGTWYDAPDYVLYLPDRINENTRWVLYFPGSCGEYFNVFTHSSALYGYSVEGYLEKYSPSSIMMFWRGSGMYEMTPAIDQAYHTLESIARDYGIAIHDLVTAGSSNGGYTAVKCSGYLYQNYGVPVSKVLVYDMGEHFMISHCLPKVEDCETAHQTGTQFYFFEPGNIGYNHTNLSTMIERGMDVQLVHCKRDAHTTITYDGFSEGTLSWATGEQDGIREDYYTFPEKPQRTAVQQ